MHEDACLHVLRGALQAMVSALVAAVTAATRQHPSTHADACMAVVHVLAVVKEGLYVKVLRRLHFNFMQQGVPHDTASTAASAAHRCANKAEWLKLQPGSGLGGSRLRLFSATKSGQLCVHSPVAT